MTPQETITAICDAIFPIAMLFAVAVLIFAALTPPPSNP